MSLTDTTPNFVGPDLARNLQLLNFVTIGSTAVLLWDIIIHIPEDYAQIRKQGLLKLSRIVYCFSRFTSLFYMLAVCVVQTAPIGNCVWIRYVGYITPFVVPVTLLLFLFRVYALFRNKSHILVFVSLSWLFVVGSSIPVAFLKKDGVNINGTKFCMEAGERDVADAVSVTSRFFHDTLIFVVTSWWLYQSNSTDDRSSFTTVVFGRHLLPLSRSLLLDGQAYYLATLIFNVVVIVLNLMTTPFVAPCALGGPLLVLVNNMACHVYRNLVNARYRDHCEFLQWADGKWRPDNTMTMQRVRPGDSNV